MNASLDFLASRAKRLAGTALIAGALFTTGCAATPAGIQAAGAMPQVHADVVYVSTFDITADDVRLDGGMASKLMTMAHGMSTDTQRQQTALKAREQLADELVRELVSLDIPAMRADGAVPAGRDALIVTGRFETLDAGNRRRRILIGLGAGKSEVGASVAVLFQPARGTPQPLVTFSVNADSGRMPGIAETAGVGAAAGRLATSAAVSGGVHGVSETRRDTVSAVTGKLARSIAKQLAATSATNGWLRHVSAS
ncbi:DUF4410 domain-containing protein [Burkholderia sp. Bp8963]|uniref:DUF4410 domain-containing protein n=1 Tax=Burkholderia sp. Bp8963 TaxID=2184547 RepID=UPI000F5A0D44|nr:DUF4410 domain-containing protein [Burkholderia sp. Bp8963]RQS65940.1 DUF4410 domain-containing protein [Burkholderia sp. Bp8963]